MTIEPNSVDWDLLSRAYEGDDPAAAQLYKKHFTRLVRTVRHFFSNVADAEDAAQISLMKLFKTSVKPRSEEDSVYGWLKRVCINHCLDEVKCRNLKREQSIDSDPEKSQSIPSPPNNYMGVEIGVERALYLESILDRLKPADRLVIELRLRGNKPKEIAAKLDVPLDTVYSRLRRATMKLTQRPVPPEDHREDSQLTQETRSDQRNV